MQGEVWERALKNANAGTSLAVVVPVPLDRSTAGRAGVHLREAIKKVNAGEYSDAVTEARKAMEAADDSDRRWKTTQEALQAGKDNRSLDQRLTIARPAGHWAQGRMDKVAGMGLRRSGRSAG